MLFRSAIALLATTLMAGSGCRIQPHSAVSFGERKLRAGETTITVELALTPAQRAQGLKYRRHLPENRGMLFIFASPVEVPFWMKDTLIPLSIAFLGADGRIQEILDMDPDGGATHHAPERPYLYALEMNQGWFARHGLGVGDWIEVPGR